MAEPMTADQLVKALRNEGVRVQEHAGWREHNRNHKGPFGPMHGVMIHHTVTRGDTAKQTDDSVELCYNGHSDLPGPLCHGVIDKAGVVYLVGNGRANHAGLGDGDVLQAVIDERPLPVDNEADTDGNRSFYGFECINLGDGKDPWPEAQLEAIERVSAAICRVHRWSERSVIRHLDWQPGKVDPRGVDWTAMHARIAARLELAAPKPPATPPAPKPVAKYEPFPGSSFFRSGRRSPVIAAMRKRLVAEGCGRYQSSANPDVWGSGDERSYAAWQRKLGYTGTGADGIPGKTSWDKLHVPNV